MSKLNWSKVHSRHRMQRYGSEPARADNPFLLARLLRELSAPSANAGSNLQPKNCPPTKAELAQQAVAAFMAWRTRKADRS
jgi:hypothetical protein